MNRIQECKNCGGRGCRDCHGLGFTSVPRPMHGGGTSLPVERFRETVLGTFTTWAAAVAAMPAPSPGRWFTIAQDPETPDGIILTVRERVTVRVTVPDDEEVRGGG